MVSTDIKQQLYALYKKELSDIEELISLETRHEIKKDLLSFSTREKVAMTPEDLLRSFQLIVLARQEINLDQSGVMAILFYPYAAQDPSILLLIEKKYGASVSLILDGLLKVYALYTNKTAIIDENYRKLLMTFAKDVRVIMILLVERLYTMQNIEQYGEEEQKEIAQEVSFLYAPLAHRMGLYAIKTLLEDLTLKILDRSTYKEIAHKLNATKRTREAYIKNFIEPVKQKLKKEGLTFSIKGRTKSIHSIWTKMRKQQVPFKNVYDLFAIRIIIDCPREKEKAQCWQVFSILTDMHMPNTNRLRDWISMPKSNGYESLHITVMGPEGKWVEVQIRTKRMDEVAEKGMAAHWKYKGGKSESTGSDQWLKDLRDFMENSTTSNDKEVIEAFKMQLYQDDVFAFTPKGDLFRLRNGASILDFAFAIHTKVGMNCIGAIVNGKNVGIHYLLKNGDQIKILTSNNQTPRIDWLKWVKTSKARTKIKQLLKEQEFKHAKLGREILLRRLKNWKVEYDDATITQISKKLGYKTTSELYLDIHDENLTLTDMKAHVIALQETNEPNAIESVENFEAPKAEARLKASEDVLVLDQNLRNVKYSLAKCCKPVFGDTIFGFVTMSGGIKIHRKNCPNAKEMYRRFPYRIMEARWEGNNSTNHYETTLRIIGNDDIAIVSNITSLISQEKNISLRNIDLDAKDGLFEGTLTITTRNISEVNHLIKKLLDVHGIKKILRH